MPRDFIEWLMALTAIALLLALFVTFTDLLP